MKNLIHSGYNNSFKIDYTIHKCPKILSEDIYLVFKNDLDNLYITNKHMKKSIIKNKKKLLHNILKNYYSLGINW